MDYNLKPWPKTSTMHELSSIVHFMSKYNHAPPEMRIREIESTFTRPMIQVNLLSSSVENFSQFDFKVMKSLSIIYYGSEHLNYGHRHNEAWIVSDWFSEAFARGYGHNGPLVEIYDFTTDPLTKTDNWIEVETATAEPVMDEFNLWTVALDLRYGVSRPEAEFTEPELPDITNVNWRVELTV